MVAPSVPHPQRTISPLPIPYFKMLFERFLNNPPPHLNYLSVLSSFTLCFMSINNTQQTTISSTDIGTACQSHPVNPTFKLNLVLSTRENCFLYFVDSVLMQSEKQKFLCIVKSARPCFVLHIGTFYASSHSV